jgi:hypothetical protein
LTLLLGERYVFNKVRAKLTTSLGVTSVKRFPIRMMKSLGQSADWPLSNFHYLTSNAAIIAALVNSDVITAPHFDDLHLLPMRAGFNPGSCPAEAIASEALSNEPTHCAELREM